MNSSIEGIVDLVSPEWQVKAGRIKDIAAAAVLVAAAVSVLIGLLIFSTYFF
jgi:undecaprenol kinase/diacylglycerol kinase (ATP)